MTDELREAVARAMCPPEGRTGVHPSMGQRLEMADAALEAIRSAGFAIVPREPTEGMDAAAAWFDTNSGKWESMIEAFEGEG